METPLTSVPLRTDEDDNLIKTNTMLSYLSQRQNAMLPFLPIRGVKERKLVYEKLKGIVAMNESLTNDSVFEKLTQEWNIAEVSIANKVYPKLPCHFIKYVKKWRKNQDRRDAEVASGSNLFTNVLEYVPDCDSMPDFEPLPLTETPDESELSEPTGLAILCQVAAHEAPPAKKIKRTRKKRTCKVVVNGQSCPIPYECKGRSLQDNCVLKTGGDPSKCIKRKISVITERQCRVCGQFGCPGGRNRKLCRSTRKK